MIDIHSQVWWHGSRKPLETIDFSHIQGGLHVGPKSLAAQFGPHLRSFRIADRVRIGQSKDTGEGWLKRAKSARKRGLDILVYLNRFEGIDPTRFDNHCHTTLNSMPDSRFKSLFPEAQISLLILRKDVLL